MKMLKDANNMLASNKSAFPFIYLRKLHIDMEKKRAAAYPPPCPASSALPQDIRKMEETKQIGLR
jgi:hypothetical protein